MTWQKSLLFLFGLAIFLVSPHNLQTAFAGYSIPANNPGIVRCGATATLLQSGEILVVGGTVFVYDNGNFGTKMLDTAALFDPATNTWSDAASLGSPHSRHSAQLLPSGKVLVMAGATTGGTYNPPMIYDPSTNTWSSSAYPWGDAPYTFVTMTLLQNGKVLVVGNCSTARLYDPGSDTWTAAGTPAVKRYKHTATLLPNGKVLVTGGENIDTGEVTAVSEIYDPASNAWSAAGSLSNARYDHTATLLTNGKVLIQGGRAYSIVYAAELYDPASDSWSSVGDNPESTAHATATL